MLLLLPAAPAVAQAPVGMESDDDSSGFWLLPPGERLAFEDPEQTPTEPSTTAPAEEPGDSATPPERRPNWLATNLVSAGALVGATLNGVLDTPGQHHSYRFTNEGWFGQDTHFGGADKASHFVDYQIVSKELTKLFVILGHKPEYARWLGAGVASLAGLMNEVADGTNRYGFSYQDLVMDVSGALTAALINVAGAEDLVSFQRGYADFENCCGYSNEIYTANLQLGGAARRLGLRIGPLKYLQVGVTYGTRGYPGDSDTQRRVGVEVGLNFREILDDLDIRRNTWWGYGLHVVFDNIRVPFSAVGYRFDMNHARWHGPNAGN